ncbi:MAG TPA: hypothetical protein VJT71_06095 [Pyrinomonadaceae bacterium]|nr:hypothetical protein [Pyrinomonadaceae bacterium]
MKRTCLTILWIAALATVGFSQAQAPNREQSNIEKFSAKSGTLIQKQFVELGKIKTVTVELLVITDLVTNARVAGVRMEYEAYSSIGSDTKIAFLDADEVDGLIKSISLLKSKVLNTTPDNYTEVVFGSRGGFEAGAYFANGKWSTFLKLERYDSRSSVSMKPEDFDHLLELLQQAKQKLA